MNLATAKVLISGASGGIGAAIVHELVTRGADVLLTGRNQAALHAVARGADPQGVSTRVVPADITQAADRTKLCDIASRWSGGINVLINNAGVSEFGLFAEPGGSSSGAIDHTFAVNTLAPIHLCAALLPHLRRQPRAQIVNIGSVFGSIAYPGHAVYSASKFALRGFTEALRRELSETNVRLHYLAPRATRTELNSAVVDALNARFHVATDPVERVAREVCSMLEHERAEKVIGWPEKLFVRINALLPRLIDRALAPQAAAIREHREHIAADATPCIKAIAQERPS